MKNFNNLILIFGLTVLGLGLTGCSSDKNSESPSTNLWGIQEPTIAQNGQPETKLTLFDSKDHNLSTNDSIKFQSAEASTATINLRVKTDCVDSDGQNYSHTFVDSLKETYKFFELLPPQTLIFNPKLPQDIYKCRFDFIAKNKQGQTHRFYTPVYTVILSEPQIPKVLLLDREVLLPQGQSIPNVYIDSLNRYSVPEGPHSQSIYCTDMIAQLGVLNRPMSFNEIIFQPRDPNSSKPPRIRDQICRLLEIRPGGHVTNISYLFRMGLLPSQPTMNLQKNPAIRGNFIDVRFPNIMAEFFLKNQGNEPQSFAVLHSPNIQTNLTLVIPVRGKPGVAFYGQSLTRPLKIEILGVETQKAKDQFLFTLKPKQTVTIRLSYTVPKVSCPHNALSGIISHVKESHWISVQKLNKLRENTQATYVADEVALDLLFEIYHQLPSAYNSNNPTFVSDFKPPVISAPFNGCRLNE